MSKQWYSMAKAEDSAEVFIYDEIGAWGITAKEFAKDFRALGDVKSISLRINSPGGSVSDGMAIYSILKQSPANITAYIDGLAASMGSVIPLAADRVIMPENALMMIHEPWTFAMGNAEDMRKEAGVLDKFGDALCNVYVSKTGLDAVDIKALMADETWMSADDALGWGFIDEIDGELQAAACVPEKWASMYKSVPEQFKQQKVAKIELPTKSAIPDDNTGASLMPEVKDVGNEADKIDVEAVAQAAVTAERTRVAGIKDAFAGINEGGKFNHLIAKAEADGSSVEEIKARVEWLAAEGKGSEPAGQVRIEAGLDASEKFKAGVKNSLESRAGISERDNQNEYNGYTMLELARASLRQAGASVSGDKLNIVGQAFTHSTSDFKTVLMDVAQKSMMRGFDEAEETFDQWTVKGNLSDFKQSNRVGTTAIAALRELAEGGEYKHATFGDYGESIKLATFGEMFSVTRQAIINDDMAVITSVPRKMGRAARRTVGDLAYAALTSNPAMGDGTALFHADHGNLNATGTAITTDSISAIQTKMMLQKGRETAVTALNIRPAYLLCPAAQSAQALTVQTSTTPITADAKKQIQGVTNIVANTFQVISDARLDADSPLDWYMVASPGMHDTIEVAYLDGNESPFLDQQQGWSIDGTEFKVRIDAAAAPMEFASMYKQAGA